MERKGNVQNKQDGDRVRKGGREGKKSAYDAEMEHNWNCPTHPEL